MIKKSKTIVKAIFIIFIVIILLKLSLVFLWPFLFSIILVLAVEPMVKFFISKGMKRSLSVVLTYITYFIIVFIFGAYLWHYIGDRIVSLSSIVPNLIDTYKDIPLLSSINENYERILLELKNIVIEYKGKIFETIMSTLNGFVYFFIIIFAAFLISIDLDYLSKNLKLILGDVIYRPFKTTVKSINTLISIEFKLVSITIIISTVSFALLGFDDSLSIGIICGILDLLPIVGPLIIFLPIILYLLTTKQIFIAAGLIFTFLLIIVVRQIVEIKLLQGNLVLKPVFVIFALYIGVILFGGVGVLFGPILLIIFKEVYRSLEKGDLTEI